MLIAAFWLLIASSFAEQPVRLKPADCVPLDETEFRGLVLDAQAAIDRDDPALHASIVAEIDGRLPCLEFAPTPRLWADYLVGIAIAEFASKGDWQTPLGAAVRIRPGIDRGVGAGHPMARWEAPSDPPVSAGPLPPGVVLWVDGALATELPPVAGLHLVQREREGTWATLLLRDAPIPDGWLTAEIVRPPELSFDVQIGATLSGGGISQTRDFDSDYVPEGELGIGGIGGTGRLVVHYGVVGVLGEASGGFPAFRTFAINEAKLALGAQAGRLVAGAGFGLSGIGALEGADATHDAALIWFLVPEVCGMGVWLPRNDKWRFGASVGIGRTSWRLDEWATRSIGRTSWYVGGAASTINAKFQQVAAPGRRVTSNVGTFSLAVGIRAGGGAR